MCSRIQGKADPSVELEDCPLWSDMVVNVVNSVEGRMKVNRFKVLGVAMEVEEAGALRLFIVDGLLFLLLKLYSQVH